MLLNTKAIRAFGRRFRLGSRRGYGRKVDFRPARRKSLKHGLEQERRGRVFLIDTENVSTWPTAWKDELTKEDELAIFHTSKSQPIGVRHISRLIGLPVMVSMIPCHNGTPNALDFILVSWLGKRLTEQPEREFIIVSNDTGYDAVCRYWFMQGYCVSRRKCDTMAAKGKEKEVSDALKVCLAGTLKNKFLNNDEAYSIVHMAMKTGDETVMRNAVKLLTHGTEDSQKVVAKWKEKLPLISQF